MKKKIILIVSVIVAIAVLIGLGIYQKIKQSYEELTVADYTVQSEQIENPLSFVLISDLHDNIFGENNKTLVETIAQQNADLILMCGDMLNEDSDNSSAVEKLISDLSEIAPIYYALGNHEIAYMENTDPALVNKLTIAGASVLEQEYEDIVVNGQNIRIGGMYAYAFPVDDRDDISTMPKDVYAFLCDFQDTEAFTLMMAHRPESCVLRTGSKLWDVDLVVTTADKWCCHFWADFGPAIRDGSRSMYMACIKRIS